MKYLYLGSNFYISNKVSNDDTDDVSKLQLDNSIWFKIYSFILFSIFWIFAIDISSQVTINDSYSLSLEKSNVNKESVKLYWFYLFIFFLI